MGNRRFAPIAILIAALALMAGAAGAAVAQDATPAAGAVHPAHIHSGTCETLGDVVFPLNDVTMGDMMATPDAMAASTPVAGEGEVVAQSMSTVDVALDDVLAAEHAINVHLSADEIGTYIACGDVTGEPTDGMLEIELLELNDSGYTGMAMLMDNGDGTTDVTIMLMESGSMATPAA
jgi:hypothetical protein